MGPPRSVRLKTKPQASPTVPFAALSPVVTRSTTPSTPLAVANVSPPSNSRPKSPKKWPPTAASFTVAAASTMRTGRASFGATAPTAAAGAAAVQSPPRDARGAARQRTAAASAPKAGSRRASAFSRRTLYQLLARVGLRYASASNASQEPSVA